MLGIYTLESDHELGYELNNRPDWSMFRCGHPGNMKLEESNRSQMTANNLLQRRPTFPIFKPFSTTAWDV
jgi:hypothetical protein